jgi:2-amino-4-hydroxy-6-hydroxymethyldihydropteridine diphosphokinase
MPDGATKPVRVYIGVGSNINPRQNIERALDLLGERISITAVSPFYASRAVGGRGQPDFINGVLAAATTLPARELKYGLLRVVEERLERRRTADKNAARTIDLDVLLYGDLVIDEPGLTVPDAGLRAYPFVARPLLDLDEETVLPDCGERLLDLFPGRAEEYGLTPLKDFSDSFAKRAGGGEQGGCLSP